MWLITKDQRVIPVQAGYNKVLKNFYIYDFYGERTEDIYQNHFLDQSIFEKQNDALRVLAEKIESKIKKLKAKLKPLKAALKQKD